MKIIVNSFNALLKASIANLANFYTMIKLATMYDCTPALMRTKLRLFFALLMAFFMFGSKPHNSLAANTPRIFELFTSQGCSSCPPADKLAQQLSRRDDVLVLSYHVNYWNYLGWRDPYSSEASTQRQKRYAVAMDLSRVYTPQAVIQGKYDVIGFDYKAVNDALYAEINSPWIPAILTRHGTEVHISLPYSDIKKHDVWLITYRPFTENAVPRGENSGKKLQHVNSVTRIRKLLPWNGMPEERIYSITPKNIGIALLIQSPKQGALLGGGWIQ